MTTSLHDVPAVRRVLAAQLRAVGTGLHWLGIAGGALLALASVLVTIGLASSDTAVHFRPHETLLPGLLGLLLPVFVWRDEAWFGTDSLRVLPVDPGVHALVKVLAGWAWLMAAVAVFVAWLLGITLASGGNVLAATDINLLPTFLAPADALQWQTVQHTSQPLLWLSPFAGATVTYLAASAILVGPRHPLRWFTGTLLALALVRVAGETVGGTWLRMADTLAVVAGGRIGLDTVLTGRTHILKVGTTLPSGEAMVVWRSLPDTTDWVLATSLWLAAGLLAVIAAAYRHRAARGGTRS